jgi:hypothetical protein
MGLTHHTQNIELGEFAVMPNHIDGVLILTGKNDHDGGDNNGNCRIVHVETGHALSLRVHHNEYKYTSTNKHNLITSFKYRLTQYIKTNLREAPVDSRIHPNKSETGILLNGFQEIALRKTS